MSTEPRRERHEVRKDLAEQYKAIQTAALPKEGVPRAQLPQGTNPVTAEDVLQGQQMAKSYRLMKASTIMQSLSRVLGGVTDAALGNMSVIQAGRYIATGDELTEREKHALRLQYLALLTTMAQGDYLAEKMAVDYATDKAATKQKLMRAMSDVTITMIQYAWHTKESNTELRKAQLEFVDSRIEEAKNEIERLSPAEDVTSLSGKGKEVSASITAKIASTPDSSQKLRYVLEELQDPNIPPQDAILLYKTFLAPLATMPQGAEDPDALEFANMLIGKKAEAIFPNSAQNQALLAKFQTTARATLARQASNQVQVEEAKKELEIYQRKQADLTGGVGGDYDPTLLGSLVNKATLDMIDEMEDLDAAEALSMAIGTVLGYPTEEIIAATEATQTPQGQQVISDAFNSAITRPAGFSSNKAMMDDLKKTEPERYRQTLDTFAKDAGLPPGTNAEDAFNEAIRRIDIPRYTPPPQLSGASTATRGPDAGSAAARQQVKDEVTKQLHDLEHPGQSELQDIQDIIMATPEFSRWKMSTGYTDPQEAFKEFIKTSGMSAEKFRRANRANFRDQTRALRKSQRGMEESGGRTIDDILTGAAIEDLDVPDPRRTRVPPTPVGGDESPDSGTIRPTREEDEDIWDYIQRSGTLDDFPDREEEEP